MPLKPHPTDPDKMVYVKREYILPKEWVGLNENDFAIWKEPAVGILKWAEATLKEKNTYKPKKEWVGLTEREISEAWFTGEPYDKVVRMLEVLLKEKNGG